MKRCLVAFTMLSLLLLILLPACGGGGEESIPTLTATPMLTATPTNTPTNTGTATPGSTQSGPVKIGVISVWSGPAAMAGTGYVDPVIKTIEKQVKDMGGILGGRSVKFFKYDNRNTVADSAAGVTKLFMEDQVCILTCGGISAAQFSVVADEAEKLSVPYVTFSGFPGMEEKKFTVAALPPALTFTTDIVDLVTRILKAKTVAFIQIQEDVRIERAKEQSQQIEAAGGKTVYMQDIPVGTSDFMPYLTKIKQLNPDVLVMNVDTDNAVTVAKQITELGGWGNTQVVGQAPALAAAKMPGAEGWIVMTVWTPGRDYPASQKFEQDYEDANGRLPSINTMVSYLALLTAIEAIKLAGTDDPIKIAQAMRSGKMQFDTPAGIAHYNQEGESGLKYMYVKIQKDGTTVEFK